MSQSAFPTEWYFNITKAPTRDSNVADRIAKIKSYSEASKYYLSFNIYYSKLSYQLVEESPYWDTFLLFSNIGGNLGLFVGMSFLSFVEVFELVFQLAELLFFSFFSRTKRARTPVVPFNQDPMKQDIK